MIRILLVDDRDLVLQGIQVLLEDDSQFKIVGTAKDGRTAVEEAERLQPDIVLLDLEMPKMNGITATEYLSCLVPDARVILLTSHEGKEYLIKAQKAGARGYLLKNSSAGDLKKTILTVNEGYSQIESKLLVKVNRKHSGSKVKPNKPMPTSVKSARKKTNRNIKKNATPVRNKKPLQTNFSKSENNGVSKSSDKQLLTQTQKSLSVVNRASLAPIFESSAIVKATPHQIQLKRSPRKHSPLLLITKLFEFEGASKILLLSLGIITLLIVIAI
jgi:DNA-binding NarL/FixJ family response regulator